MPLNHPIKLTNDGKKERIEQAKLAIGNHTKLIS